MFHHSPLQVITNHLGYRNGHGRKLVLVSDVPEAAGIFGDSLFTVFEQNEFSKHSLNSDKRPDYCFQAALNRQHTDFGTWLVGDFSHLRDDGIYQAWCGNEPSPSFAIRDDVYLRILPECLRYFQVQSCGRAVPGWHPACHLDDGYVREEDKYLEAAGGWHDAGDFRKWASSTCMNAIALLVANRLWGGREESLGLPPGILLQEALQGLGYFLGIQDPETGALYQNIGGGRDTVHDNLECRYTDNEPQSGDERRIHPQKAGPAGKFTTLFALYAGALKDEDPAFAKRAEAAARLSAKYDHSQQDHSATALMWRAWGYLELYRAGGQEQDKSAAITAVWELGKLQVDEFIGGQRQIRGFFHERPGVETFLRKHVGADYAYWVIAEFLREFPDHPRASHWRESLSMWIDDYVLKFAARNPFGLLPYALYTEPPKDHPDHHYRQLGDRLYFRYFMAGKRFGTNARSSLAAAAIANCADVLGRPGLLDHAYRLLEWTLGNNPYQISTMNGVGVLQPCALSFQMGNIPGGVTMGIFGDEDDMPWYPHPWACTDEYYGYQTSQFLWALAALQNQHWR